MAHVITAVVRPFVVKKSVFTLFYANKNVTLLCHFNSKLGIEAIPIGQNRGFEGIKTYFEAIIRKYNRKNKSKQAKRADLYPNDSPLLS